MAKLRHIAFIVRNLKSFTTFTIIFSVSSRCVKALPGPYT